MKKIQQQYVPPLVAFMALLLAGCFGGSDRMNEDSISVPETVHEGSPETRYAENDDTLDSITGMAFSPLSAPIIQHWGDNAGVSLSGPSGTYVDSITQNADGGVTVVFVIDGQEQEVQFTQAEFESQEEDGYRIIGSRSYQVNPARFSTRNPLDKTWFDVFFWSTWDDDSDTSPFGEAAYGLRTKPENLPMGTASYNGYMVGRYFDNDGNSPRFRTHRRVLWGEMGLEANFDESTITGQVDGLWVRNTPESGNQWSELPDTTSVDISGGSIVGGRFTADWAGQDTDSDNPATTSVRGFEGDIVGDFYGPGAEEVAGVFNGHRDATDTTPEQFISGIFGGEKEDE